MINRKPRPLASPTRAVSARWPLPLTPPDNEALACTDLAAIRCTIRSEAPTIARHEARPATKSTKLHQAPPKRRTARRYIIRFSTPNVMVIVKGRAPSRDSTKAMGAFTQPRFPTLRMIIRCKSLTTNNRRYILAIQVTDNDSSFKNTRPIQPHPAPVAVCYGSRNPCKAGSWASLTVLKYVVMQRHMLPPDGRPIAVC